MYIESNNMILCVLDETVQSDYCVYFISFFLKNGSFVLRAVVSIGTVTDALNTNTDWKLLTLFIGCLENEISLVGLQGNSHTDIVTLITVLIKVCTL